MTGDNRKPKKQPTSIDVAKAAGVSQSTVSRVFSEKKNLVKPEMQEKVLRVAKELGYRPNLIARGMAAGNRTNIVALVIGDKIGPYYTSVINLFIEKVQDIGKQCLIFRSGRKNQIDEIVAKVIQFHVEAVIITASAMAQDMLLAFKENDIPVLLYNRYIPDFPANVVYSNPLTGGAIVADYLYRMGHRKIGYVRYPTDIGEEAGKRFGFYTKVHESGMQIVREEYMDFNYESGYQAAVNMFRDGLQGMTAVFCTSDIAALGFVDGARKEYGIRIPEDLSVIGYDDIEFGAWESYGLTTVSQPKEELVTRSVEVLCEILAGKHEKSVVEVIQPHIVERSSVRKIEKQD